jgi:uncharacterized protein (TIRG00374 family)
MKGRARVAVSLAVTAFFLWLALRGVDWPEVWTHLRDARWGYLAVSIVVSILAIHVRALRWRSLLAPLDPNVALQPRVAGTAIGFAANNLIPARVGELVRAVVCGKLARLPVSGVFATLVVERVLDGLVTVGLLFTVMALPGFPSPEKAAPVLTGMRVLALLMGIAGVGMIVLAMMPARSLALVEAVGARVLPARARRPALKLVEGFIGGLGVLRNPRLLAVSLGWAVFQWLFISLSIYFGFRAFGITEPGYRGALFLQSAINLAVAVPSSPGFFGPLEAAARYGLGLWGVDPSRAASFAIGYHLGGFIPVTLLGLWYVQKLDLSWRELIGTAESAAPADGPGSAAPPAEPRRA